MRILFNLLINSISILIAAYLVPGVNVGSFWVALVVAVVMGVLNALLKPILVFLTLPINILTLGLFTFVINAVIILIVGDLVPGFGVASFWSALFFGIVLSLINTFLGSVGE